MGTDKYIRLRVTTTRPNGDVLLEYIKPVKNAQALRHAHFLEMRKSSQMHECTEDGKNGIIIACEPGSAVEITKRRDAGGWKYYQIACSEPLTERRLYRLLSFPDAGYKDREHDGKKVLEFRSEFRYEQWFQAIVQVAPALGSKSNIEWQRAARVEKVSKFQSVYSNISKLVQKRLQLILLKRQDKVSSAPVCLLP